MSTGSFPLHLAAVAGDTDVMEILLQAGAKLTVQDNDKCTPLHKVSLIAHLFSHKVLKYFIVFLSFTFLFSLFHQINV